MVSALSGDRDGAGYSESLKRLLDGGVNLVRLNSPAVNWHLDALSAGGLVTAPVRWEDSEGVMEWTHGGDPLLWFTGPVLVATVTMLDGFAALSVSGLTPGRLVCRAFDVVRVYAAGVSAGTARVVRTVHADNSGVAVIPLHSALPAGIVSIGDQESAVFEAMDMPRSPQPMGQNWFYQWNFREVLADEIPGDTSELDPWR